MSRSNPTESAKHPSTRWIEYGGKDGHFRYYDKETIAEDGSPGDNIDLGPKIMFLYLDTTYTVTGWSDFNNCGITSNEVKDISNGILTVKPFKGNTEPKAGTWTSIKEVVKGMGGKFTANIYVAYKGKEGLEIGVLQLKGAAYAAWNEFAKSKGKAIYDGAVKVVSHKDGKKGAVEFKTPVFEMMDVSEESNVAAIELDKELQAFFQERIPTPITEPTPATSPKQAPKEELSDEEMFGEKVPTSNIPPLPTEEDEPFDDGLDDDEDEEIPF